MNTEHLWIHHDYLLSAFPLCMAWFNFPPSFDTSTNSNVQRGNFVAVGTFEPAIEVWDLDVMDSPPCLILGGSRDAQKTSQVNTRQQNTSNSKAFVKNIHNKIKKKTTKSTESDLVPDSHTKGVISLSWNTLQPYIIHFHLTSQISEDNQMKMTENVCLEFCVCVFQKCFGIRFSRSKR
jgi:periodic tryptophan protein 1